ncbi:MAG TPA: RagB/SusD family nutrient uptake outer membrane protein [Puia sp.]|uniref:RagB/SusD family nutrient uptake outer membrane protein n=1 Tax=Puia sp. TaxID=2045100 RepID=UPI002C0A9BF3|nr:RagB/SusD family nutrient uptake outer membrane protein [Puia sp.]HVU94346.1 RagB/SusD family nutrient uptake outer membrane protein [Puia sp.]
MHTHHKPFSILLVLFLSGSLSCKKLVSIPEPINTLTTTEVFTTDAQANSAMAGVYSEMINGTNPNMGSTGNITALPALSSDEMAYNNTGALLLYATNHLLYTSVNVGDTWGPLYSYVYGANAIIQGIGASTSGLLHDSVRKELTGEAKFVRAFSYFYLTNLYGDVPLALTIDFSQTENMARTPQATVYRQIIQDLKDAQTALPSDYSVGAGERIRPNKWAATALLARVYLYTGDNVDAAAQASAVIANTGQYSLVSDLNSVFLKNSTEAIWQLQQNTSQTVFGNATPDGFNYLPNPLNTGFSSNCLSNELLGAFENGDGRRSAWVDSTDDSNGAPAGTPPGSYYFPYKYKTGKYNYVVGGTATEYYMVLRLAEMYLVRAEAAAGGAAGGTTAAIADLDVIRQRAGLSALPPGLLPAQVDSAVAHERQIELFGEWGHRWLDLKRTGQAHAVLSRIPRKQPWAGDYQLLYPIPLQEIQDDHNLTQNPGYN